MDKDELIQRLMATFTSELEEHVRGLETAFLELEREKEPDARAKLFKTLLRTAHSLKGAARSVNVSQIETACHYLEDILTKLRDGQQLIGPRVFSLLFETADALREAGVRLNEGRDLEGGSLSQVLPKLSLEAGDTPGLVPDILSAPSLQGGAAASQPAFSPDSLAIAPSEAEPAQLPGPTQLQHPAVPPNEEAVLRISAEKLDALQVYGDELLTVRQRAGARTREIAQLQELVRQWRAEWHLLEHAVTIQAGRDEPAARQAQTDTSGVQQGRATGVTARLAKGRDQLRQFERALQQFCTNLACDVRTLDTMVRHLNREIHRARMQPFARACDGMERMVRDLCSAYGKVADLRIAGGSLEIDRSILVGLKDPLRHLIRNAVDHGIEPPDVRTAAGKPQAGRIEIRAALQGDRIEISVTDDGRGFDLLAIRQQAERLGHAAGGDEAEVLRHIFLPGFSTASSITEVSGRGVGLDVVKSAVEAMRGTVSVSNRANGGAEFCLALPLTLTTIRALLVSARGQMFAFDTANVERLLYLNARDIKQSEGRPIISLGGEAIPLLDLAEWLTLPVRDNEDGRQDGAYGVVLRSGERSAVVLVDELVAEQESTVRSLGPRLAGLRTYVGGTLLPHGHVALILNASTLLDSALRYKAARSNAAALATAQRRRLLVVDDSVTTRTLEKSILEGAGYEVETAADGAEAWQILQAREIDLVVSDVEMPRMDGFALTEAIRNSKSHKHLPVILVTAQETDEDKERGLLVGADAYILKSAFDQSRLLDAIAQIL